MNCGIYCIHNLVNNKVYIGKSTNIAKRWRKHRRLLKDGKHTNTHLQSAYVKYGVKNFLLATVELCPEELLNEKEIYWIIFHKSTENKYGYNKVPGGTGGKLNPESLARMAASMRGKKMSKENKNKIKLAITGVPRPQEVRDKISKSKTGEVKSVEHKRKISIALKGRKLSLETRIKMSKSRKGIKQPVLVCPYCHKNGGTTMYRWHFDNCKGKNGN